MPQRSIAIAVLDAISPSVSCAVLIDVRVGTSDIACRREGNEVVYLSGHPILEVPRPDILKGFDGLFKGRNILDGALANPRQASTVGNLTRQLRPLNSICGSS